jgi:glycosyltransferase involved in cell wall biosynthesis
MLKYSVIIPVYKAEAYLDKCVSSVLAQKGEHDFELILVDDGSPDSGGLMCDGYAGMYPDKVRVIHQENAGPGAARNAGVDIARGEYVYFMDSDDTVLPEAMNIFDAAVRRFDADVMLFDSEWVWSKDKRQRFGEEYVPSERVMAPDDRKDLILVQPCVWSKLFRRALFTETGIRFPNLKIAEDLAVVPRLIAAADKVVYVKEVIYRYYQRESSIMNSPDPENDLSVTVTLDSLRDNLSVDKVFCDYSAELEYLALSHIYIAASVRAIRSGRADSGEYVKKYREFMASRYPRFGKNKYISRLDSNKKLVMLLLRLKMYGAVGKLFELKGKAGK